jgi:hypothetical protein
MNEIRDIWMWWGRKWLGGGKMVVVSFSQESLKFISGRIIRSKCDRDPGFFARDSLGRKMHG